MKKLDYKLLSDSEKELVLTTRPKQLRKLDEDELVALHGACGGPTRTVSSKLYRRRAAQQVGADPRTIEGIQRARSGEGRGECSRTSSPRSAAVSRRRAARRPMPCRDERGKLAAAGAVAAPPWGRRRTPRDTRKGDRTVAPAGSVRENDAGGRPAYPRATKARKGARRVADRPGNS